MLLDGFRAVVGASSDVCESCVLSQDFIRTYLVDGATIAPSSKLNESLDHLTVAGGYLWDVQWFGQHWPKEVEKMLVGGCEQKRNGRV